MGTTYLLDSNIIIDVLNGRLSASDSEIIDKVLLQQPVISVITKIEVLGWNAPNDKETGIINEFMKAAIIIPLDDSVAEKTIELRKKFPKSPKLPDAIIASTALVHGFCLLTSDSDFSKITGLTVVNPF